MNYNFPLWLGHPTTAIRIFDEILLSDKPYSNYASLTRRRSVSLLLNTLTHDWNNRKVSSAARQTTGKLASTLAFDTADLATLLGIRRALLPFKSALVTQFDIVGARPRAVGPRGHIRKSSGRAWLAGDS